MSSTDELAGASGFLGSSVFSWVRSAIYNRKLYNNIVLPTKNSVPERAGEGSARESTRTHVGKAQADAAEPKIIAAEAHDPCGTTRGARSAPAEANLATKSLGRSSPDPDRPATNQAGVFEASHERRTVRTRRNSSSASAAMIAKCQRQGSGFAPAIFDAKRSTSRSIALVAGGVIARPCRNALCLERPLPLGVRGPVLY